MSTDIEITGYEPIIEHTGVPYLLVDMIPANNNDTMMKKEPASNGSYIYRAFQKMAAENASNFHKT